MTKDKIHGAMVRTKFLADQIYTVHHALQPDRRVTLQIKWFPGGTEPILNCPSTNDFFYVGGYITCQHTTLAEMLVQIVKHVKKKSKLYPKYQETKCQQVI